MVEKLIVIFFILLCLMSGITLILFPWINFGGVSDWSDNYFLALTTSLTGTSIVQNAIGSGWIRGAVSGLGVLNLYMAFSEIMNFTQTAKSLEGEK
jgi:hypothetical protein